MRKIVFFDRELKRLGGHYINLKLHHFFSLFMCPFYVFVQKALHSARFGEIFLHSIRFGEFFFHSVRFGEFFFHSVRFGEFSAWFNSFQLFTHSKNSLQYQFLQFLKGQLIFFKREEQGFHSRF